MLVKQKTQTPSKIQSLTQVVITTTLIVTLTIWAAMASHFKGIFMVTVTSSGVQVVFNGSSSTSTDLPKLK